MSNSLNLELPYVQAAQAQKHVTVNEALRRLDAAVQLVVEDRTRTVPPASPEEGERHVVAAGAGGAWAGHALEVAAYLDGAWVFFTPREGWLAFVRAEGSYVYFSGAAWDVLVAAGDVETATRFGVNALADDVNRLTVQAEAALFAPDPTLSVPTGDARVKVTKTAAGDVASHLFQTGYSGRAEFGLIGSDDFSLKVSPDGSAFEEAFRVDRQTTRVDFAAVPQVGGAEMFALSLPSRAALASTAVPASVARVETRGHAAENDGGGGTYERVSSLPADDLGVEDAAGGFWSLVGGEVRVRQAGAVGDGVADDTDALRRALQSGRTVIVDEGRFRVTGSLTTGATNQTIAGVGRRLSRIEVDGAFDMSAAGVFEFAHSFASLSDVGFRFDQSSATARFNLVEYPPAVFADGRTRGRLSRVVIERAFDGVVMRGNTGGWIFDDVECGSLNVGFEIDGALDSVEYRNCRVWPYGFAADVTLYDGIYLDGGTIGFRIGKVDDLKMVNCTVLSARVVTFPSADGTGPFGHIVGLSLDNEFATFDHGAGQLTLSGLYSTKNATNDYHLRVTDGAQMFLSSFFLGMGGQTSEPLVLVEEGAVLTAASGQAGTGTFDNTLFEVRGGQLKIENCRLVANGTVVRTRPLVRQANPSGHLVMIGNSIPQLSTGSGVAVEIGADSRHVVLGNQLGGYTIDTPGPLAFAVIGPNKATGGGADFAGEVSFETVRAARFTGEVFSVPDDGVATYTPATTTGLLSVSAGSSFGAIVGYSTDGGVTHMGMTTGSGMRNASGALGGTTGPDGTFTVSAHTDGLVYLENRTGGARAVRVMPLG